MKVVINADHGGFGLSEKAIIRYNELKGRDLWIITDERFNWPTYSFVPKDWYKMTDDEKDHWNKTYQEQTFYDRELARDDPILIQVIEELGELADGRHSKLKIVEIPDDVKWQIDEYDGQEWVAEEHRTWE
jgi:hypothetical protein